MVLNESKHFSSLDGCRIMHVPDDMDAEEIGAELMKDGDRLTAVRRFAPIPTDGEMGLGIRHQGTASA